ncbi:MAG: protease modulator HflC [bacterium]|nr:protease modulator HflC [bacterium]
MVRTIAGFLILLLAVAVFTAVYIVPEGQQVVITRFGEPIGDPIVTPGLKFKVPLIDKVRVFDKRFLEWDGKVTEIPTKEKRNILVDTYARWKITDPLVYLKRFEFETVAQQRLSGILNGETRDAVARHDLAELIRTTDREEVRDETLLEGEAGSGLEPIEIGREAIRQEILRNSQARVTDFGIEILDVQFKRINYVKEVRTSVYERMIAERKRIADRFRSEGEGEASRIRGDKERELKRIQSEAYREAQEIVGDADAEATEIYAKAYNQSSDSRAFYQFLKTMESYGQTFDEDTWVVLSTEGDYYKYLVSGDGR